ncbi:hypothetical protein M885DRAFT_523875 [Pelagophyceae sp. CCMP2097]|nr:hypothetical protein M885DRAFT_523875 [Pelagophyceae sp. CCMP2097]
MLRSVAALAGRLSPAERRCIWSGKKQKWRPPKEKKVRPPRTRLLAQERKRFFTALKAREEALEAQASSLGIVYTPYAATIVERKQVVIPEPSVWEIEMWTLQQKLMYWDQFDYPESAIGKERRDIEYQMHLDSEKPDIPPFPIQSRTTQADLDDDRQSWDRALPDPLYLLVKQNGEWNFPNGPIDKTKMLRANCLHHMTELVGPELYTYILGNAPQGCWLDTIDATDVKKEYRNMFFMKAIIIDPYTSGPVLLDNGATEFVWSKPSEIRHYMAGRPEEEIDFYEKMLWGGTDYMY